MNTYVTGKMIKELREKQNITQTELAEMLYLSDKTISKWETNRGFPDISLIEPLSKALKVSVIELLNGEYVINKNRSSNVAKTKIYVCPICGNVITSTGDAIISCCGNTLIPLESEEIDIDHEIKVESIEDEYYISLNHEMTKNHYISFIAYLTSERLEICKLYSEGACEERFFKRGRGIIMAYCNHHRHYHVMLQ